MPVENNPPAPKQNLVKKSGIVPVILILLLVGVIVVVAMQFLAPTIGDVYSFPPDFESTETQAALDCNCDMRSEAWLDRSWWDGLPEGKLVVIAPKTFVHGEQYQAIAFAYSPDKFSNNDIDEQVQGFFQRLNLSEDTAIIIKTDVFLDTWGYPRLTNFRLDRYPDYIDPEHVTVWIMEYDRGNLRLNGSYISELRFYYDENYSEPTKCNRICKGDRYSNWAPHVYEQIIFEYIPQRQNSEYPLVENFNSSQDFISTDPDLYIRDGYLYWKVSRSEGVQYIYRPIPPFSGDVKITVTGQIDGYTNNCQVRVGIGDGIQELGEPIHETGISINFGFTGGGCPTNGPVVHASGVDLYRESDGCSPIGSLWVKSGTPITVSLTVSDTAILDIEGNEGKDFLTGTSIYNGEYNTMFVGLTDNQDWPSCWGTIDSIVVVPLNEE